MLYFLWIFFLTWDSFLLNWILHSSILHKHLIARSIYLPSISPSPIFICALLVIKRCLNRSMNLCWDIWWVNSKEDLDIYWTPCVFRCIAICIYYDWFNHCFCSFNLPFLFIFLHLGLEHYFCLEHSGIKLYTSWWSIHQINKYTFPEVRKN